MLAAISVRDWIDQNPSMSLAAAIVLIGLFGLGWKDVLRFSLGRTAALASVNFRQALRRRVLWITPLLMLGIIAVNQFQRPLDPQDAMRQATMICLFATGLLVTILLIMLACTSLPSEIESRVIYTVATKPATRLEMIVGKILGFAYISASILLIMGLFTWGYLHVRDWQMRSNLATQLATPGRITESLRPTIEYYRDYGTLHARTFGLPQSLNVYAHVPSGPDDRWSPGGDEGEILVRFAALDRAAIPRIEDVAPEPAAPPTFMGPPAPMGPPAMGPAAAPQPVLLIRVPVKVRKNPSAADAATPATAPAAVPRVGVTLSSSNQDVFLSSNDFGAPQGWEVSEQGGAIIIPVLSKHVDQLFGRSPRTELELSIIGFDADCEYTTDVRGIAAIVPETGATYTPAAEDLAFVGRSGQYGQQLRGGRADRHRVAVYQFAGQAPEDSGAETVAFELRMGVERVEEDFQTTVVLDFYNHSTGKHVGDIQTMVETNRPAYLNVPAAAVEGGDFDVVLHTPNNAWLGLQAGPRASIKLIKEDQSFAWNLLKSLAVFWMLGLLVAIIAVFCSTFLSWPIAVVLTVIILMGRWAAEQFSDMIQAGMGRQVVTDMFRDSTAAGAKAVSESVDALMYMLRTIAAVLPDISKFSALQDIQQGLSISPALVLLPSLWVTVSFGLPLLVLAYVFLKYKEVAP